MSGFEIAGVVLGALPILFEAIDWYKNSIHRAGVAFRRRKHVDKLARALLLQKQTLEETVKSIIVASGCEDIWRLEDDPLGYLNDENVQSYIGRYLGSNDSAFIEIIKQSNDVVKEIARNIAGLVPSYKVRLSYRRVFAATLVYFVCVITHIRDRIPRMTCLQSSKLTMIIITRIG